MTDLKSRLFDLIDLMRTEADEICAEEEKAQTPENYGGFMHDIISRFEDVVTYQPNSEKGVALHHMGSFADDTPDDRPY